MRSGGGRGGGGKGGGARVLVTRGIICLLFYLVGGGEGVGSDGRLTLRKATRVCLIF